MTDLNKALVELVRRAGDIMLSAHEGGKDCLDSVKNKPGVANFVTEYDVRVQEFLINGVKALLPSAAFIAEDKDNDGDSLGAAHCFIIDPIDGTTNFIHNSRRSCISLAMLSFGETVFGCVYDPYLDEMFTAEKGKGAYINGSRIYASERTTADSVVSFGTAPYYRGTMTDDSFAYAKDVYLMSADLRRSGTAALDLVYVAAGRLDGFFELSLFPWDIAAGKLIAEEAGGIVTKVNGQSIHFNSVCSVLAGNQKNHADYVALGKKYGFEI